MSILVLGFN